MIKDPGKNQQWGAFIKKNNIERLEFRTVVLLIEKFLTHPIDCIMKNKLSEMKWYHSNRIWK